jgi:hypothetical protein
MVPKPKREKIMIYTEKEKTEFKYTVQDAINAAANIARDRNLGSICLDSVQKLSKSTQLTLVGMNLATENILSDTCFYK